MQRYITAVTPLKAGRPGVRITELSASMNFARLPVGDGAVVVAAQSTLPTALACVHRRLLAGERQAAIRELDRLWRTRPADQATVAPLLGRLLVEEGEAAGLNMLRAVADAQHRPDVEAQLIWALWNFGQLSAAVLRLAECLQRYAIDPESSLARSAREIMASGRLAVAGWAAITPKWQLYVELPANAGAYELEIQGLAGERPVRRTMAASSTAHGHLFNLPRAPAGRLLRITADGQPLLGGELSLSPLFALDARSTARGRRVGGWVRLGWHPAQAPLVELADAYGKRQRLRPQVLGPDSRWYFELELRDSGLRGSRFDLAVRLPDGRWQPFADNPLLLASGLAVRERAMRPRPVVQRRSREPLPPPVDVIIPVYRGRAETMACIAAVCATVAGRAATILVVDDATPDAELAADLDRLAEQREIQLLRNAENLGFSASVNRAMAINEGHDAVLVNADVVVFGDWLLRLQRLAYSAPKIGSVTPFTDDDSVAHYTYGRNDAVARAENAAALDAYAAVAHRGASAALPVGVGYCMYVRRQCWRETGPFDAAVFGKGYGEESDWSMRARRRHWKHLLAADVFVHHAGGRSFGERRAALLERCARLLELRHPGYHRRVSRFLKADSLQPWRRSFDVHRLRAQRKPIVLILTLALPGGVHRFVTERCRHLERQGKLALLLRPRRLGSDACMLRTVDPQFPHLRFEMPAEIGMLRELLTSLPIEAVEFNHFIGLDPRLVDAALGLGVPYEVYLHDYSWICPRVTLVDETRQYCGEPQAIRHCERCVARNGSDLLESISVRKLRQRSAQWLAAARRIVAPSHDVASRYARYFPGLSVDVEPLENSVAAPRQWGVSGSGPVRVALLGGIGAHKGYQVLRACVRDVIRRGLELEFVVIGYSANDDVLRRTGKVFVTGEYRDGEVSALLRRERPDVVWLPSVWPETWCYTLTHALAAGVPIVAFDIGAIAERLRAAEAGVLLPLGLAAHRINDALLDVARDGNGGKSVFHSSGPRPRMGSALCVEGGSGAASH